MPPSDANLDGARWFFPDVPVATEEADSFGHGDLANNLETAIRFNQGRVMIGLLGGFGVGKSSVIRLLERKLSGTRTVLRISAERHEIPVFHRAFVFAFAEAVEQAKLLSREKIETELEVLHYEATQQLTDWRLAPAVRVLSRLMGNIGSSLARRALALGGLAALATVVVFLTLLALGVPVVEEIWTWLIGLVAVVAAIPVIAVLVGLVSGHGLAALGAAVKPAVVNRLRPRVEAADEYERVFASLVQLIPKEIVIAIDDVDRLSADDVLPALNAIRSFQLTSAQQPAFIVSADEEVIARAIRESSPSLAGLGDGDEAIVAEYLSRLFTHRQQMPPHAFADLRAYARQLLESPPHPALGKLAVDLDSVIQVLVYDGVKNPRHVIRLLNSFLADYRLATLREQRSGVQSMKDGTVTRNPKVLARLAVLRLDFPRFYRVFATDTQLLTRIEQVARADAEADTAEAIARQVGIDDAEGAEYKALEAYVARTAGWVESVDDLLPFIYLGQDEIDRAVGSVTVRRVRSILSNGLTADFLAYLDESSEEGNVDDVLALIRSTVDGLTGPELSNALTVLDGAAAATSDQWLDGLAESFATSIRRAPNPELSVRGLSRLAAAASEAQRATILDVLLARGKNDLAWSVALIAARPEMDTAIAGSTPMDSRIEAAIALIGEFGDVTNLGQIESASTDPSNSTVAHATLMAHLQVLSREQDATKEIRTTVAKLVALTARDLSLSAAHPMLSKMISEPGSVSSEVAFDVLGAMELIEPTPLADLAFDIALGSLSNEKFADGVDEDYLAGSTPVLLAGLEHSSDWTYPIGDENVPLPQAVGKLVALATEGFSWIDNFTDPVSNALRGFPAELSPLVIVVANSFENYANQDTAQQEWDLIVSMFDDLETADRQVIIDTLVRMLSSADNVVRSIAVAKLPAFLRTNHGAASADAMAASIETGLSRSTAYLLDALEVLLDEREVSAGRQQSVAQNIYNSVLSYSASRPAGIAALCSISWQPAVRPLVAQLLASYPSEISHNQVLAFAGPMEPLSIPPVFTQILEGAAAAALAAGDLSRASTVVGNLSSALTAAIVVRSGDDADEPLRTWLSKLGEEQRLGAIGALFAVISDEELDPATVKRTVAAYANSDQEAFDAQIMALVNDQLIEHIRSVSGLGWTLVLSRGGDGVLDAVGKAIISAWVSGSSSDVVATAGPGAAAASIGQLDVQLAPEILTALGRWIEATPNDAAAEALGQISRGGTELQKVARGKLDRPGPRKNAASRDAFRKAKSAFGLGI